MIQQHELYMRRCLQLAALGLGNVQPNPMVGAIIIAEGKIIGEGWHRQYGSPHAEIEAIHSVVDKELLKKSTLYVNLEPCSHFGKTPPCADAIIEYRIPRVVIGNIDPHNKVNGGGIRKLKDAGIETVVHVLENECRELNRRFFTYHLKKRPYIILKWAQTADGFMDVVHDAQNQRRSNWITNNELRTIVHQWRGEEQAIAVGYNTFINDRPQLTTRFFPGKNPERFIFENNTFQPLAHPNFESLPDDPNEAMSALYHQKITSLIVEGGRKTLDRFLETGLWDEIRILTGDQYWGKGVLAPIIPQRPDQELTVVNNKISYVRRHL